MIQEMADAGRSRDEIRTEVMLAFGVNEAEAEFMIAIALGEIDGDVVMIDEQGREIRNAQ